MRKYVFIENLERLKTELPTLRKKQYYRLLDQCDRYFYYYLPEEHPALSTTYMGIAIVNLALAYLLSSDKRYLDEAQRFMLRVCSYKKWGNAHLVNVDLSASWILFGLSLGYDWLKEDLDKDVRVKIYDKLVLQGTIMYDYKIDTTGKGWSTNYYQNHNWINLNGIATCGYALKGEFDLAEDFIKVGKENFKNVFDLFADDGSNYEGVVYWHYGGMWLFVYAHLLKVQEGIDYFKTSGYLRNTFYYRFYQSAADLKHQLNFGDCHDRYSGHAPCVYYKTAAEYNDGYAQEYANYILDNAMYEEHVNSKVKPGILPQACFEFLWYEPKVEPKKLEELPKVRLFEDLGLINIRNGFSKDSTVFSFKCGYPGGKKQWLNSWKINREKGWNIIALSHHHPDNNHFIINKGRAYFATDDGYNRHIDPTNHNMLIVDGKTLACDHSNDVYMTSVNEEIKRNKNFNPETDFYGEIEYFYTKDDLTIFKGQTAKIYDSNLKMKDVSRLVVTNNLNYIIMVDSLNSELEHTYQTVLNSDTFPKVLEEKYVYTDSLEKMTYSVYSKDELIEEMYDQHVSSVMTTQEPTNLCHAFLKTLSFKSKNKLKTQKIIEVFNLNNEEIFCCNDIVNINNEELLIINNAMGFEFDADAIYVNILDNKIKKLILINGTTCIYNGVTLINETVKSVYVKGDIDEILK